MKALAAFVLVGSTAWAVPYEGDGPEHNRFSPWAHTEAPMGGLLGFQIPPATWDLWDFDQAEVWTATDTVLASEARLWPEGGTAWLRFDSEGLQAAQLPLEVRFPQFTLTARPKLLTGVPEPPTAILLVGLLAAWRLWRRATRLAPAPA